MEAKVYASVVCSMNGGIGDSPEPGSPGIMNGPGIYISVSNIIHTKITVFLYY